MALSGAPRLSWKLSSLILVLSLLTAYIGARIAISPLTLLLLSPITFLGGSILFVAADLYGSRWVEKRLTREGEEGEEEAAWGRSTTTASGGRRETGYTGTGTRTGVGHKTWSRTVPPLIFTSPAAWSMTQTRSSWEAAPLRPATLFPPSIPPALSNALGVLLNLITRDFILRWFSSISDSPAFPNAVQRTISETLVELGNRVAKVSNGSSSVPKPGPMDSTGGAPGGGEQSDWSDLVVGRILPLVTAHIETFRSAELALRGQSQPKSTSSTSPTNPDDPQLDLFLASKYASLLNPSRLHQAVDVKSLNSRQTEEAWLSKLVGKLLPLILPGRENESEAVSIMTREIVANMVLLPVVEMLSDPDFWNRMIDEKAGAAIRDQEMVAQFRNALDAQSTSTLPRSNSMKTSLSKKKKSEEISALTPPKQFDAFVKGIGKLGLLEARRTRSDLMSQIRRWKGAVDGKDKDDVVEGIKVVELLEYIDRLHGAKRKAEKRIEELGGTETNLALDVTPQRKPNRRVTLRDILLNPTSLSYFMEFQDRRRRSLHVQFWLLIEGLKDPLEGLSSSENSDDETAHAHPLPSSATVTTTREDMKMIWDTYFALNSLRSNAKYVRALKEFLERDESTLGSQELRRVRKAVFAAQRDVLGEMEEEDFPVFEKSDLFFKALAEVPEVQASSTLDEPFFVQPTTVRPSIRPRALSNPFTPTRIVPPLHRSPSPSPSPRTISPPPPFTSAHPSTMLQRTETAPPQVTFQDAFDDRPINRRTGSEPGLQVERGVSPGLDERPPSIASTDGGGVLGRRRTTLSDSLDFLMGSPGGGKSEDRSPLFNDDLFGDEDENEEQEGRQREISGPSLEDDDYVQVQTIEAIQEALNSILATDSRNPNSQQRGGMTTSQELPPRPKKLQATRPARLSSPTSSLSKVTGITGTTGDRVASGSSTRSSTTPEKEKDKDDGKRRGKGVFGDEEDMDDLEEPEDDAELEFDPASVRLAAPGDLQLPGEIARLGATIEKLQSQEAVVGALIRKAELTGKASELKILLKSRDSLRREMRALAFQKSQYESQESENKLVPGRTTVTISGTTVGQAAGQSFQLYLVEVHQLAADGSFASGWIVTRRYSEFSILHLNLREKYTMARQLDLPSKRLVTSYNENFIEQRKMGLEKYLQALVRIPVICQSMELRSFLSQQNISLPKLEVDAGRKSVSLFPGQGLVRSIYRSVTSGIDEMFSAGPSSMMETIIQRLSQQAAELSGIGGLGVQDEDLVGQMLAAKGGAGLDGLPMDLRGAEEGLTYFTAPICELFVTLFELKEKNNWLRRQAILIILQQILGGTIERKFRDTVKMLVGPVQLVSYINILQNALWPGGQLKPKEPPRTAIQRAATKDSANRKLSALMPDVAANLIGRSNARHGARRLFSVLQNRRLNRHLIYTILDELLDVLFPEIAQRQQIPFVKQASRR